MPNDRAESAYRVRVEAAALARHRPHPVHKANGDEERYAAAHYPMSFTKGLAHDPKSGLVADTSHFEAFRSAIDNAHVEAFTTRVPVPTVPQSGDTACGRRKWEAPTAGVVFDLEGPDAQAVTMPPAPELCSDELAFEMAEVYELALLRDVPLTSFDHDGGAGSTKINESVARLNATAYAQGGFDGRPRKTNDAGDLDRQTVFRGSSPGVENGPYLSQFLLIGNGATPTEMEQGQISYGAQRVDQRVPVATENVDYMQSWEDWLDVQDGFDVNTCGLGAGNAECSRGQSFTDMRRFICTPRDLATYVHFDALYQAYLNATLILLGMGTPFDPGFAKLSGSGKVFNPLSSDPIPLNAGGFALWGGPHILTLVTEVATRALKAVRFQKFNNHLRLRPEALAARMEKAGDLDAHYPSLCGAFGKMYEDINDTVRAVIEFNDAAVNQSTALLPMAFAEGSPMHPTYGAGHATVAGACTTIVKAFFDTGTVLGLNGDAGCSNGAPGFFRNISAPLIFQQSEKGKSLKCRAPGKKECPLTLEGELNKLAANISIGRNMAGVHYFSDYYDSLRMGEEIAIGMLEEQAVGYPTDDFVLSVPTFDGDIVRIGRK